MSRVPIGGRRPRAFGLAVIALLATSLALSATPAQADTALTVVNPGFEVDGPLADGAFINPISPSGWVSSDPTNTCVFNPTAAQVTGQAHGGVNVACAAGADIGLAAPVILPVTLSQVLAQPLQYGYGYRLSVWVGRRIDGNATPLPVPEYVIQLVNLTDNSILCQATTPFTSQAGWVNPTCQGQAALSDLGDVLQIRLIATTGPNSVQTQVEFDDVSVTQLDPQRPPPPPPPTIPPPPPPPDRQLCYKVAATVDLALGEVPTAGPDRIAGTPGADVINGLGGNDIICGRGGNDRINGGSGNDTMFGSAGNDSIFGGTGNDIMRGRTGVDDCHGGPGSDVASECETTTGVP